MPFIIRPSVPADVDAITAIYAGHVLNGCASFEEVPPDLDEMSRRRAAVLSLGLPHLVAEIDGVVVGYAYAGLYRSRSAYRFTAEDSIYLTPAATGRGIGRALMTRLIAECEAAGMRNMIAVIGDGANAGSIGLHRAMGFTDIGVMRATGWKHGRWLDTVLMGLMLGEGDATAPVERILP